MRNTHDLGQQALDAFLAASAACMGDSTSESPSGENWQQLCDLSLSLNAGYLLHLARGLSPVVELQKKSPPAHADQGAVSRQTTGRADSRSRSTAAANGTRPASCPLERIAGSHASAAFDG
jgi:hypothetical protein